MQEQNNISFAQPQISERDIAVYLSKVMGWMFVGLLTTLAIATVFSAPRIFRMIYVGRYTFTFIMLAQIGVVFALRAAINRLNPAAATMLFILYSALTGITFSTLYHIFELASIVTVFGLAALMFLTMSIYGFVTKRDLSRVGSIAIMALFGVIIASVFNMFFNSSMLDFIVCIIGLALFIGLTAYDVQRIKHSYVQAIIIGHDENSGEIKKLAIYGALELYLDFINMFLYLLRLLGKRR